MSHVPSLSSFCLDALLRIVEANHFHPQTINDICKYLQGAQHLLNPILEFLIERKAITDVALSVFLIPDRVHLNLTNCLHIKKSTLKQIGLNCPHLLSLNLSDCQQVSNAVVRSVLTGCGQLLEIRLDRCMMVTDSAFDPDQSPFHPLIGCRSLESVSMQGCNQITGKCARALTKACHHLKSLNLAQCKHISAPCIQSVFQHHHLLRLNLSFSDVISDESFMLLPSPPSGVCFPSSASKFVAVSYGKLQQLNLGKSSISDLSLARLAHTYGHSLQRINLEWCSNITDEGVKILAEQCCVLMELSLQACKSLSDESVRSIGKSCSHLIKLDLSWCCDITDSGIMELTPSKQAMCSHLQSLCVKWTQMTGESLGLAGLQSLPELREVNADGCEGITSKYVHVFEKKGIDLRI